MKKTIFLALLITNCALSFQSLVVAANYNINHNFVAAGTTPVVINNSISKQAVNNLFDRYSISLERNTIDGTIKKGALKTTRFQLLKNGLGLLKPSEFITGTGLSSVVNAGPHNDYLRWTQRIGVIAMLIGFFPFIFAASKAFSTAFRARKNALYIYLSLSICFILYHSIFGYPREDVYQAFYCFLGLAMWLGINKENGYVSEREAITNESSPELLNPV